MKYRHLTALGVISLALCLYGCNYQKVPAPPPSKNAAMPNLNSNAPPRLHPTLVLQKTTPVNKLSQS